MSRAWLFPILIAGMLAVIVAVLGATITEIGPWYRSLVQPRWAPPEAAYGVAWTAIFACTALGGVTGWLAMPRWSEREWLLGLFALNGFVNILWSLLFFRLQRPDWALVEVLGLWMSVAALVIVIWRRSMTGAVLLLPYLLWVTFAGYLNMTIVRLNGPVFLTWLFASGHAVDIVLAVMAVELAWLVGRGGWGVSDAVLRLAPGALMLVALRGALTGLEWPWIALPLLLSFPVHLADLTRRR